MLSCLSIFAFVYKLRNWQYYVKRASSLSTHLYFHFLKGFVNPKIHSVLSTHKYIHMLSIEVNNSVRCGFIFFRVLCALCASLPALSAEELANLGGTSARVWVEFFSAEGIKFEPCGATQSSIITCCDSVHVGS